MEEKNSEQTPQKRQWQQTKENWYDKLNLSLRTLDTIIVLGIAGLVIVFVKIFMDAGLLG